MLRILTALSLLVVGACAGPSEVSGDRPQSPEQAAESNAQLALAYLERGQRKLARDLAERAVTQDSRSVVAQRSAAIVYERLGQVEEAEKHYKAALKLSPDDADLNNRYGAFLCAQGKAREGEVFLLRAAQDPTNDAPELARSNLEMCRRSGA